MSCVHLHQPIGRTIDLIPSSPIPLTHTEEGSSYGAKWSADGKWIPFLADRHEKTQLYLIRIDKGLVHADSVVSTGWSQGGYISAFLATNSQMFKAISVGAGISNWMTYYVNTDIHPFTRQYLKGTPWSDKSIY